MKRCSDHERSWPREHCAPRGVAVYPPVCFPSACEVSLLPSLCPRGPLSVPLPDPSPDPGPDASPDPGPGRQAAQRAGPDSMEKGSEATLPPPSPSLPKHPEILATSSGKWHCPAPHPASSQGYPFLRPLLGDQSPASFKKCRQPQTGGNLEESFGPSPASRATLRRKESFFETTLGSHTPITSAHVQSRSCTSHSWWQ